MPTFIPEVFANILRYLVLAAQNKRAVPYYELENVFGLSHNMAGYYAGQVGHFCVAHDWPLLNSLVVNTSHCMPSEGFDTFLEEGGPNWGTCLANCWQHFHVPTSRHHQVQNFSGLTSLARNWAATTHD